MNFGDILAQWDAGETKRQNSASNGDSAKRQDGGAWRSKKLEPDSQEESLSGSKTIEM